MMKLSLSFVLLLGLTFTVNAQSINGRFKVSNKGDISIYNFTGDSSLAIIHGKDTVMATYAIDTALSPMSMDIQYYDSEGKASVRQPCIYEWVGKDKIRLRISENLLDRPKGFMPKGNKETMLL
ncbi:MAG: hypothetical protein IT245_01685, partial [Bacteroidia bacterium]|nr:hypothetical protein [Bacteroidia bacterium]